MGEETSEAFVSALTTHQIALRGYIRASIGSPADVDDVLQKTNMVLWKKSDKWDPSTPFLAWAFTVARFEVLAFYRDRGRDRLVFDEDVMELMGASAAKSAELVPERVVALRQCLHSLKTEHRALLTEKYANRASIDDLARMTSRSHNGVKSLLLRVRKRLNACVTLKVEKGSI